MMETIADSIKKYARASHTSVAKMERVMMWGKDTVRKMTLPTEKNKARVRMLAEKFPDLFDLCPELRTKLDDVGVAVKFRDERLEMLEALLLSKDEIITLLREENRLLREKLMRIQGLEE